MTVPEITNLIWAVGGLLLAGSVTVYLWRNPRASARIKHKESEIALEPSSDSREPAGYALPELATDQPKQLSSGNEPELPGATVGEESERSNAFEILSKGDYEDGKAALQELAERADTHEKRVSLTAFGQQLAAGRGSDAAFADLTRLSESHGDVPLVRIWLGVAQHERGLQRESIETFNSAWAVSSSDQDRVTALLFSVEPRLALSDRQAVIEYLLTSGRELHDHQTRARVLARVARLLLESTPPGRERAFPLYELALKLDPLNVSLRFDVAHAYGEAGAETQAFCHYSALITQIKDHDGAHNNIAVAADNLEMPSLAVAHYRKAESLGNTLASANIAWKLIGAGFLSEARTLLDAAAAQPDAHRNVLSALGGVAKAENSDEERKSATLKRGAWHRAAALSIAESVANGVEPALDVSGTYMHESTKLDVLASSAGTAMGVIVGLFSTRDFQASLIGNALLLAWTTRKPERATLLGGLYDAKSGHGVLAFRNGVLEGYTYEGSLADDPTRANGYEEWTFRRAVAPLAG